jgi:hypothetical protein
MSGVRPAGTPTALAGGQTQTAFQTRGATTTARPNAGADKPSTGWGVRGTVQLPGYSVSSGTDGTSVGVGPDHLSLGMDSPSIGVDATVPVFGPLGVTGGVDLGPDTTAACLGPSLGVDGASVAVQACYTFPYGYQQATDWAADQVAPVLAPLNDPATWLDPFSSAMGFKR